MTKFNDKDKPVRVGVFGSVDGADRAVHGLLDSGFTKDEITVICSDETKERFFREARAIACCHHK